MTYSETPRRGGRGAADQTGTNGRTHSSARAIPPGNDTQALALHAIEYAAHGWPVFPLRGKEPAIRGGRGLYDATTDLDQVREYWRRYPDANIGLRPPGGIVVIDIDPRHGGDRSLADLHTQYEPLPTTLTVISGRGDGVI